MSYDYRKLNARIIEIFETQAEYAKAMGLSERSVSLKLNNKVPFKQPEISKTIELLDLKKEDVQRYFFAQKVK